MNHKRKKALKVLADMDETLDQLIHKTKTSRFRLLEDSEIQAIKKTQASLISHLIHIGDKLDSQEGCEEKVLLPQKEDLSKIPLLSKLNAKVMESMAKHLQRHSKLAKKKMLSKAPRIGHNRRNSDS